MDTMRATTREALARRLQEARERTLNLLDRTDAGPYSTPSARPRSRRAKGQTSRGPIIEGDPEGDAGNGDGLPGPGVTGTRWCLQDDPRPGPRRGNARRRVASRRGP